MDDKELIEVWRKEFESIHGAQARFPNGEYAYPVDQYFFNGFCMAKRSQQSIVMPRQYNDGVNVNYDIEEVHAAITAAGIKYTLGNDYDAPISSNHETN